MGRTSTMAGVLLLVAPGLLRGQSTPLGPLRIRAQSPIHQMLHVPEMSQATPLSAGVTEVSLAHSYASVFAFGSDGSLVQDFDQESLNTVFAVRRGLGKGVEVGARFGLLSGWAGFLDGVIQGLHNTFGFPNGDRHLVDDGRYRLFLADGEDVLVDVPRHLFSRQDVELFSTLRLVGDASSATEIAVRGTVQLGGGATTVTPGRTNGEMAVMIRGSGDDVVFHGMAGVTSLRTDRALSRLVNGTAGFVGGALEIGVPGDRALLIQWQGLTPYLRDSGRSEVDGFHGTLAFGFSSRRPSGWAWEVSFAEDVPPDSPAVDFVLDLRFSKRW